MSADRPALSYAAITRAVGALISYHSGNDRSRAAYMIARAAALEIKGQNGAADAAERFYQLADEMTGDGK